MADYMATHPYMDLSVLASSTVLFSERARRRLGLPVNGGAEQPALFHSRRFHAVPVIAEHLARTIKASKHQSASDLKW